jgi:hypothetical protein
MGDLAVTISKNTVNFADKCKEFRHGAAVSSGFAQEAVILLIRRAWMFFQPTE